MPDLFLLDFETTGLDEPLPTQYHAELWRWDNKDFYELGSCGAFVDPGIEPHEWDAFEFHEQTGFLEAWELAGVEERMVGFSTMGVELTELLDESISSDPPILTARNPGYEVEILERLIPYVLDDVYCYGGGEGDPRTFDTRILDLHPGLNRVRQQMEQGGQAHFADYDVRMMVEILADFLAMMPGYAV